MKELGKSMAILAISIVTVRLTAWGIDGVEHAFSSIRKKHQEKKAAEAAEVVINAVTEAAAAAEA